MDNLNFKRLPGNVLPTVPGISAVIVETSAGALNWIDSSGSKEIADKTWANNALVAKQFTDSQGAINYVGQDVGAISVSTGTHIFTNCTGELTVSGNSATVYVNSCPALTINGKTTSNWSNIWIDGIAFTVGEAGSVTRYSNGTQIIRGWANSDTAYIFPVAFFENNPNIMLGCTYTGSSAYVSDRSLTDVTIKGHNGYTSADLMAIGRWK